MSTLGKQFEALKPSEQWAFVLQIEERSKIEIHLDNDCTHINFGDEDENYQFKNDIYNAEGVFALLGLCVGLIVG